MVVWTDGKPRTVIKAKPDDQPHAPFQYRIPLSKYSTLATVAQKRPTRHPYDADRGIPSTLNPRYVPHHVQI